LDGLPRKRSGTYSYAKEVARGIIKDARYAVDGAVLRARAVHDLERAFEDAYLGASPLNFLATLRLVRVFKSCLPLVKRRG
jgi:hypothetical protein